MSVRGLAFAAAYVAALPAAARAQPTGEQLFNDNCAACHQRSGLGVKGAFPPLAGNKLVQGPADPLTITVLTGRGGMPAFKSDHSDDQLAAILSYVRGAWGNKAAAIDVAGISAARAKALAAAEPKDLLAH